MMSDSAFKATFSDFKNVKTRKVLQLIFEVPAEAADAAMAVLGGVPMADREIWVGIARIDPTKAASAVAKPSDAPVKERRRLETLPLPQQIALTCDRRAFEGFIESEYPTAYFGETPEEFVRKFCGVLSRSEIKPGTAAAKNWEKLNTHFLAWLQVNN